MAATQGVREITAFIPLALGICSLTCYMLYIRSHQGFFTSVITPESYHQTSIVLAITGSVAALVFGSSRWLRGLPGLFHRVGTLGLFIALLALIVSLITI